MTQLVAGKTVSVYLFRRSDEGTEFLVLLRSQGLALGGTWQAVHGHVELGERAVDAALREVREETGLTPARFYVVEHVETLFDPEADEIVLVPVFAGEVVGDTPVTISREHERAEWCDVPETLSRLIWPTQREAIRRIVADFAEPVDGGPLRALCQIPIN